MTGPPGSRLASLLGEGLEPMAPLRAETGCLPWVVSEVSAPDEDLARAATGLPDGVAQAEAIALRLRDTAAIRWDAPSTVAGVGELLAHCRERGRSSVAIAEAAPELVPGLQLGSWFDAPWRSRLGRRAFRSALTARSALSSARALWAATDGAFWSGVEEAASRDLWRQLTGPSYVALVYHRFPERLPPGQERVAIHPRRFARQLRALRMAGFSTLCEEQLIAFHSGGEAPRRGILLTIDDATADSVGPLSAAAGSTPLLFVPTAEVGGRAHWLEDEPIATWAELRDLAGLGVSVGSHGRNHRRMTELDPEALEDELAGSRAEIERETGIPRSVAYPNGAHDPTVCTAARAAGYRLGFTTRKGRNGGLTDPMALRRVSVQWQDGVLAMLWKATTGEDLPTPWRWLRAARAHLPLPASLRPKNR